jgi:hypothetical protein
MSLSMQIRSGCIVLLAAALLIVLALAPNAIAAPNPGGTGQPNAECGEEDASQSPPGFDTAGFAHAETLYAGEGHSADNANSDHAVSQYDVACYQVSNNGD